MNRLLATLTLVIAMVTLGLAQENVSIAEHQEEMDTAEFSRLVESYNNIIRADEEKLHMFTIDLLGPLFYALTNWGDEKTTVNRVIDLAYEQKFSPTWSWIVGSAYSADRASYRELQVYAGGRYYYNMNRRILKGKSANNFSANYIGTTANYGRRFHTDDSHVTWNIVYGIQRRVGRRGFLDFTVGLENIFNAYEDRETGTDLILGFRYGLAF
ncbi:MAG: hypothetical protein RIC80_05945 [Cyclobacteriaceae bacterium]